MRPDFPTRLPQHPHRLLMAIEQALSHTRDLISQAVFPLSTTKSVPTTDEASSEAR